MDFDDIIQKRHSVRKFSKKKPDWRDIIECINATRFAPMAGNNFTLKFIVVDDPKKIEKFRDCCQQNFVSTAHYVVVALSIPDRTINCYDDFGEKFCRQQAGAAIENFLLKIQEKGLATCWVGYFVEEHIKKLLKIPNKAQIEAIFPIGYEFKKEKLKRKIDMDRILFFNEYENKQMKQIKKMDV